jgi:hypothetical protein
VPDVVLGIERLQSLIFGEIQPPIDLENAVFDVDLNAVLVDARHFENNIQCVGRFIDVGVR